MSSIYWLDDGTVCYAVLECDVTWCDVQCCQVLEIEYQKTVLDMLCYDMICYARLTVYSMHSGIIRVTIMYTATRDAQVTGDEKRGEGMLCYIIQNLCFAIEHYSGSAREWRCDATQCNAMLCCAVLCNIVHSRHHAAFKVWTDWAEEWSGGDLVFHVIGWMRRGVCIYNSSQVKSCAVLRWTGERGYSVES